MSRNTPDVLAGRLSHDPEAIQEIQCQKFRGLWAISKEYPGCSRAQTSFMGLVLGQIGPESIVGWHQAGTSGLRPANHGKKQWGPLEITGLRVQACPRIRQHTPRTASFPIFFSFPARSLPDVSPCQATGDSFMQKLNKGMQAVPVQPQGLGASMFPSQQPCKVRYMHDYPFILLTPSITKACGKGTIAGHERQHGEGRRSRSHLTTLRLA